MADSARVSLPASGDDENDQEMGPPQDEVDSATPGDTQHRPQKRRRIPVACGACRSKKSRVRLPPSCLSTYPLCTLAVGSMFFLVSTRIRKLRSFQCCFARCCYFTMMSLPDILLDFSFNGNYLADEMRYIPNSATATGRNVPVARYKISNAFTCHRRYQQPLRSRERKSCSRVQSLLHRVPFVSHL